MSEDESRRIANSEEQDVEAHLRRANANDEGATEGEGDDDVEGHVHRSNAPKKN